MDDTFLTSLFPGVHRVLGRKLPPLSLWHLACLHAISSPLVTLQGEVTFGDLQLAVRISRMRWPQQPDFRPRLRDAIERVCFSLHRKTWQLLRLRRESEKWMFYRNCYNAQPSFWEVEHDENTGGSTLNAPEIMLRVVELTRVRGLRHAQIWNEISPGYSAWLVSTNQQRDGAALRFLYPEDELDEELPDLNALPDDELEKIVSADLGPEAAALFMEARRERLKKEAARTGEPGAETTPQ
jgi:hypothetical protein